MIIRTIGDTLLLITQPDHAALAARIMERWSADGLPANPRHTDILHAVGEHDNGWQEVDRAPMVDPATGELQDFVNAPSEAKQGVWPRGVERLNATPYTAALVAQHAVHVYDRFRSDAEWAPFFTVMGALRDRYLTLAAPASREELWRDYAFVRLGDLLSLTFCNDWTDAKTDDFGYVAHLDGTTLRVTPDPFGGQPLTMEVSARELPNRPFRSPADALAAFQAAPLRVLKGLVVGVT